METQVTQHIDDENVVKLMSIVLRDCDLDDARMRLAKYQHANIPSEAIRDFDRAAVERELARRGVDARAR